MKGTWLTGLEGSRYLRKRLGIRDLRGMQFREADTQEVFTVAGDAKDWRLVSGKSDVPFPGAYLIEVRIENRTFEIFRPEDLPKEG